MDKLLGRIADYIREADKVLLLLCIFASGYGCVAILSATRSTGSARQFMVQVVALALGLVAAVIISNIDYKFIAKLWPLIAGGSLFLVALTFFIGYSPTETENNRAWLQLPANITTFQPSELLKIAFIITFALHVSYVSDKVNKPLHLFLLCIHGALPVVLIHFQGDDGTALVFAIMFMAMMFAAGVKARYFVIAAIVIVIALPILWYFVMSQYQKNRIISLFKPDEDLAGNGYQQFRGRVALASGGIFGQGLFNGIQSGKVPENHNDFIFATIGEELGMVGCLAVIILLAAICIKAVKVAQGSKDTMGSIICIGVFAMLAAQIIINLGMCLSVLPVVGVTLPFFSAGGSSLLCLFLGIGLVLSVYMHRNDHTVYLRDY